MLQRLSRLPLHSLAKSSGFVLRRPRKLSLEAFLQSLLLALHQPIHFQLGCLTDNDQKASPLILDHLQPGDLVIRDLGYAVLKVWRQIAERGAYFLSRFRSDFVLFDPQSHQPLELLDLVRDHSQLRRLPRHNPLWVQIQLLAKLLAIVLLKSIFAPNPFVAETRTLSPLKIAAYLSRLLPLITASPHRDWFEHFCYYCRYDTRSDRVNFFEKLASLC